MDEPSKSCDLLTSAAKKVDKVVIEGKIDKKGRKKREGWGGEKEGQGCCCCFCSVKKNKCEVKETTQLFLLSLTQGHNYRVKCEDITIAMTCNIGLCQQKPCAWVHASTHTHTHTHIYTHTHAAYIHKYVCVCGMCTHSHTHTHTHTHIHTHTMYQCVWKKCDIPS